MVIALNMQNTDDISTIFIRISDEIHELTVQLEKAGGIIADALSTVSDVAACTAKKTGYVLQNHGELPDAFYASESETTKDYTCAEKVMKTEAQAVRSKKNLAGACDMLTEAMQRLRREQTSVAKAVENCSYVTMSGISSLNELTAAAEKTQYAAEKLQSSYIRTAEAAENLAKASEKASDASERYGRNSSLDKSDFYQKLKQAASSTAVAAACEGKSYWKNLFSNFYKSAVPMDMDVIRGSVDILTDLTTRLAEAAFEMAAAFSEAESVIIKATGAAGGALDGLSESMMDAWAASRTGSLDEAAAVVGEINTRLGLTGEALSQATVKFLDFASATGGNAAGSVRGITQLMKQWEIEAYELTATLDKLTLTGQLSGISVDSLTSQLISNKAVLSQLGFTLEQAMAMFAEFELAGTQASSVMAGFSTALSNGSVSSMEELYDVFEKIESGSIDAAKAAEIFGTGAGRSITDAVRAGVLSLDDMVSALENADGTLEKTAKSAQTTEEKWEQATNNVSAAFSNALSPAIEAVSAQVAGFVNSIGTFLNNHPVITKMIVSAAISLGTLTAAFAASTFAAKVAVPALTEFGIALNSALGPIGWIPLAITGISIAVTAFTQMTAAAEDGMADMTAATRAQYDRLQMLNEEYETACDHYGKTSEEALLLKNQMNELSAEFEANRQTVEEFVAEVDALCESAAQVTANFAENMQAIQSAELGTMILIEKYEELAKQENLTGIQEEELNAVTKKLAENYPDLAAKMDSAADSTNDYVDALKKACEEEAEEQRQQQAQDTYVEAILQRKKLTEELEKAQENLWSTFEYSHPLKDKNLLIPDFGLIDIIISSKEIGESIHLVDQINVQLQETDQVLAEIEAQWEVYAERPRTYSEVCIEAFQNVQAEVDELITAYNEAYEAARSSIDQTIGLFDEMSARCEFNTEDMISRWKKQIDYLSEYKDNLKLALDYGIDRELILALSDGSEESAGTLAAIVDRIGELKQTSGEQADQFIEELNDSFSGVEEAKDLFAGTVAEIKVDFSGKMDELQGKFTETLEKMGDIDGAAAAAEAIMDAYTSSIQSGTAEAVSAAAAVAEAVSEALADIAADPDEIVNLPHKGKIIEEESSFSSGSSLSDIFLDNFVKPFLPSLSDVLPGPFAKSFLFPAGINPFVNAGNSNPLYIQPSEQMKKTAYADDAKYDSEKRIRLEIAGSGAIGIGGQSKESILEVLQTNLKPVLMNLIRREIYEEGDLAYEY